MEINECYDIDNILREAEATFQIDGTDYGETNIQVVIDNVKHRISRQAQVDLRKYKMTDPELSMGVYHTQAVMFTSSVALLHSKFCGLAHIQRYLTQSPLSMNSINWLGYTAQSMKTFLTALQRKATLPSANNAVNAIREKMAVISNCREKRLFMILIIADAVGFPEIVAAIAEILYQATL